MKINFREPNADRFVEILVVARKKEICVHGHIANMPKGYSKFIHDIDPALLVCSLENAQLVCEYPPNVNFTWLFKEYIPDLNILERIQAVVKREYESIDSPSMAILKHATEKLNFNKDDIQVIIDVASVIAMMDNSDKIRPEHIAEAIQYQKKTYQS